MRYTSAVVLSTLAVGQVAAHNARHASFHARRQAESKRDMANVNWNEVSYDLSNVDWNSVFGKPASTPAPAVPSAKPEEPKTSQKEEPAYTEPAYTPAPTTKDEAPKPSKTAAPSGGNGGGECGDELKGVEALIKKMGICEAGKNDHADNGNVWIGEESSWKTTFHNDGSEDVVLFCWADAGSAKFTSMSLNANQPAISVNIAPGCSRTLSFAAGVPAACAPAYPDTKLADFGGVSESWFEATFGQWGAFDISRNVNMHGSQIKAKGSKCTSSLTECVFSCTGGRSSCEKGYTLDNCGASSGGGGGYDPIMQGVGGGCAMGENEEHINAYLSPQ